MLNSQGFFCSSRSCGSGERSDIEISNKESGACQIIEFCELRLRIMRILSGFGHGYEKYN